jgi:hypothetical protein
MQKLFAGGWGDEEKGQGALNPHYDPDLYLGYDEVNSMGDDEANTHTNPHTYAYTLTPSHTHTHIHTRARSQANVWEACIA